MVGYRKSRLIKAFKTLFLALFLLKIHVIHHVFKTAPRGKAPVSHLTNKTVRKPIPQNQNFQHDKFNQNPSIATLFFPTITIYKQIRCSIIHDEIDLFLPKID